MNRLDYRQFFHDLKSGEKTSLTMDNKTYVCIPTVGKHVLSRHTPVIVEINGIPEIAVFRRLQKGGELNISINQNKNGILITLLKNGENLKIGIFQLVAYIYNYRSVMISENQCTIIDQRTYDKLANGTTDIFPEKADTKKEIVEKPNSPTVFDKLKIFTEDPFWLSLFAKKIMEDNDGND